MLAPAMTIVVTIDQRKSRQRPPNGVIDLARALNAEVGRHFLLPFDRTIGDEIQGVLADPVALPSTIMRTARDRAWWVGIGFGAIDHVGDTSRESSGTAFVNAREAVENAKTTPWGMSVEGPTALARDVEGTVALLVALAETRTRHGWEAVDLKLRHEASDEVVAHELGITRQAVQQRLQAAHFYNEMAGRRLLIQLARLAQEDIRNPDDLDEGEHVPF
jgi:hypothetical protein